MKTLLDHGYITLVETWGSDERIVEAARMSTGKGFLGWGTGDCKHCGISPETATNRGIAGDCCPDGRNHDWDRGDEKLLRYLYENAHATPFEMAGAIVEVKAPIFVFREWHRHRTQSYNEMSARYVPLPDECYIPDPQDVEDRSAAAAARNRQAGVIDGASVITIDEARSLLAEEVALLRKIQALYEKKLKAGFPKELARTHTSVSRYSRMRASANLRNWLGFMTLRSAMSAQKEIRVYSQALYDILAEKFPRTIGLFDEGARR